MTTQQINESMPAPNSETRKITGSTRRSRRGTGQATRASLDQYVLPALRTTPNRSFSAARLMATAWAATLDEKKRIATTRRFLVEAIEAFTRTFESEHALRLSFLTPPPATLLTGTLETSAQRLAATLGEEVAAIDPVAAGFWLSATYTALLPDDLRSRLGMYYTPPVLSDRLIAMAGEAGVDWKTCRVLDPACGGGAFLAPVAARMLQSLAGQSPGEILESICARLRGFEIDPFAAWMSQVFLEITMARVCDAARRGLPQLVTVCDSLEQEPEDTFDLVIGNPPYGRVTLEPVRRQQYRRSLYGHANLYGVFTDLALRWAAPGGVIAYVTPTSFLAGEYFKSLRALLAAEAPPVAIEFVTERRDVFENVIQETLLATYRKAPVASRSGTRARRAPSPSSSPKQGSITLPADPSAPWLLPRSADDQALVARLHDMKTRFADWGYTISTGPLVWNRYKDQLRSRASKGAVPLIWAEAIAGPGRFIFRAEKKNHEPYFKLEAADDWLRVEKPCVLLQRTTAKEQTRRLIAAALPAELIAEHGAVVVENHLNMVRPLNGQPKVSAAAVSAILNSEIADRAFRCISGSVAVSAFELEALPLPSLYEMRPIEELVRAGADQAVIERRLQRIYLGEGR